MPYRWVISADLEKALAKTMKWFESKTPLQYALLLKGEFVNEAIGACRQKDSEDAIILLQRYIARAKCHKDPAYVSAAIEELNSAAAEFGLPKA